MIIRRSVLTASLLAAVLLAGSGATAAVALNTRQPTLACPSGYRATKTTLNGLRVIVCAAPGKQTPPPAVTVTTKTATKTVTVNPTLTSGSVTVMR